MLEGVVGVLALLGGVALGYRLLCSGLRLAWHAAEVTAASGLMEVSARRGDLTGMAERQRMVERAKRARRRQGGWALLWLAWGVIPLLAGWLPVGYALAAPLWILPRPPLRPPESRSAP